MLATVTMLAMFAWADAASLAAVEPIRFAPELFPQEVSGAVCGFSPDGRTIYFAREDTVTKQIHLFQADRDGQRWRNARRLPFSGRNSDLGGRLSRDGRTFFFTSDRPGGSSKERDDWNIWVSTLSDEWSEPRPLLAVNDRGMECCPVPTPGGSLLFSADRGDQWAWWITSIDASLEKESLVGALNADSAWQWPSSLNRKGDLLFLNSMKRRDSAGMDDVYVSFRQGAGWSEPINLGAPVNTAVYEDGAILSHDEQWLIFCRHETAATPSRVLAVPWKPLLASLRKSKTPKRP